VPTTPGHPAANGQVAATQAPGAKAAPGAKSGAGRPQPILCMVPAKMMSPNTPATIAVIANTQNDCAAIGGSATQSAARK
jgi:hypothetical protein